MFRLVALLGFCVLLAAAVVGFGLFIYTKMGRPSLGAEAVTSVWFTLWIVLCPIASAVLDGGWRNWYNRRKDVTAVVVLLVFFMMSVAFAVDAAREVAQGDEGEPLVSGSRERQGPATEGLSPT